MLSKFEKSPFKLTISTVNKPNVKSKVLIAFPFLLSCKEIFYFINTLESMCLTTKLLKLFIATQSYGPVIIRNVDFLGWVNWINYWNNQQHFKLYIDNLLEIFNIGTLKIYTINYWLHRVLTKINEQFLSVY